MRAALAGASFVMLASIANPAFAQASYTPPKTSWGAPDLEGVWSNASVTKLTRPAGIDTLVLTPEQASAIEAKDFNNARTAIEKLPTDQSTGAPVKGKALPAVGNYNAVWVDPGSKIGIVNGEPRGVSPPLTQLSLPPGAHTIEVRNTSSAPFVVRIELRSGETISLQHRF